MTEAGMSQVLALAASFIAGAVVGLLFFGGLWLTLSGMHRARHPGLRVLISLLLRLGLVLGAFYLLIRYGGWQHAVLAALGFALTRYLVVRGTRNGRWPKETDA